MINAQSKNVDTSLDNIGDIYQQHQPWLVNWLRKKLSCNADASDISQDTFLKLLSGDIITLREPRAYLLVIANRLLINQYRRSKVETEVLQQIALILQTLNNDRDTKNPANYIIAQDLLSRIVLMLTEELPEKHYNAYIMARVDGLTYQQIATRLGVSQSSVKQYIMRVLVHCHKRFYAEFSQNS
jgi:RNA polymerase sigma-70 factor (ECF subfamily)